MFEVGVCGRLFECACVGVTGRNLHRFLEAYLSVQYFCVSVCVCIRMFVCIWCLSSCVFPYIFMCLLCVCVVSFSPIQFQLFDSKEWYCAFAILSTTDKYKQTNCKMFWSCHYYLRKKKCYIQIVHEVEVMNAYALVLDMIYNTYRYCLLLKMTVWSESLLYFML